MSTKETTYFGIAIRDVLQDEDGAVEVEISSYMTPTYELPATREELEACHVCKNCDEVRRDHLPDGKCYFAASNFEQKVIAKPLRMHPTKAHADAADPNEDEEVETRQK